MGRTGGWKTVHLWFHFSTHMYWPPIILWTTFPAGGTSQRTRDTAPYAADILLGQGPFLETSYDKTCTMWCLYVHAGQGRTFFFFFFPVAFLLSFEGSPLWWHLKFLWALWDLHYKQGASSHGVYLPFSFPLAIMNRGMQLMTVANHKRFLLTSSSLTILIRACRYSQPWTTCYFQA